MTGNGPGEGDGPLTSECAVFTAHLIGRDPSPYVCRKYLQAHAVEDMLAARGAFDRLLIRLARRGRLAARLADAYAGLFASDSALRKRLVVLLAILETSAPSHRLIDDVDTRSRALLMILLAARGVLAMITLGLATVILLPIHASLAVIARGD